MPLPADHTAAVEAAIAAAAALIHARMPGGGRDASAFWSGGERSRLADGVAAVLRGDLPDLPPPAPSATREDLALGEEAVGEFERVLSERLGLDYASLPGARSRIGDVFERYVSFRRSSGSAGR